MGNKLYILYDADGVHEAPVYGVFTSYDAAEKGANMLVEKMVKDCLAEDPKESGIDPEYDMDWLIRDCRESLAIQILEDGLNSVML